MKKILLLVLAVAMLTSCSAKKAGETLKNQSASVVTEDPKKKEEKTLSGPLTEEELFKQMEGYYFACEYVDNFKETKSARDAEDDFAAMIFGKYDGEYGVMKLDCHQGGGISSVDKVEYDGKGSYIISFKDKSKSKPSFDLELIYTPENSKVHCTLENEVKMWRNENKSLDFYKYTDLDVLTYELSKSVIEGYTSTYIEENRVGFEYNDEFYEVSIPFDTENPTYKEYDTDGYIWLTKESDGEEIFGMYSCDGYVLRIFDESGNIFAEFRKPNM